MKTFFTIVAASLIGTASAQNSSVSSVEAAPTTTTTSVKPSSSVKAAWDVLFSHNITANGAGIGNAGVALVGANFWVSRWSSDSMFVVSPAGAVLDTFIVAGVTGIRSLTTDGSFVYAGGNSSSIFKIDPTTKTLVSTIIASTVPNIRFCTYDPTANSNAGGFWVGTWATDFTLVDMSGNVLSSIAAATHALTASYGLAYDGASVGGPYLWSFHQTGGATNNADLIQVKISTGTQTTVLHDVTADMGVGGDLAGGVYVGTSPLAIYGIVQGASNWFYGYDIVGVVGINEINQADFLSVYPNPTAQTVNVRVNRTNNDPMQIQIINALGQVVSSSSNVGENNIYSIDKLEAGIYTVQVTGNNKTYSTKLIIE